MAEEARSEGHGGAGAALKPALSTRVTHVGRPSSSQEKTFINPPIVRGSTVAFPTVKQRLEAWGRRYEQELVYGIVGTPTHFALEDVVADIEGGTRCQLTSSGLSACTIAMMAFLRAGEHCLIPDSVYGPVRSFANHVLSRFGVSVTYYHPEASIAELEAQFRPGVTKVLYVESPGSHTFEMVDVAAYSDLAHRLGAKVLLDNTWGVHFFQPFTTGKVDVSIQALTKYVIGHSDALMGAIVVSSTEDWKPVRDMALSIGDVASPDDCWLALRGVRTLGIRLEHQMRAGIEVATFFSQQPEVLRVLHPALPSHPGHELYKRDYSGACSLFGVVFQPHFVDAAVHGMLEAYRLFSIGASWGGFESLVLPTSGAIVRTVGQRDYRESLGGPTVRYHIGLEDVGDLISDLQAGLEVLRRLQGQQEEVK